MPATYYLGVSMKLVFMGTADFGIPALNMLLERGHECAAIVTTSAKRSGRGLRVVPSPVASYAGRRKLKVPLYETADLKDAVFLSRLSSLGADIYVVVAFRILPVEVFSIPPLGALNIHASLLPRYRGPAPVHRAIEAGERETGVSVFRIDRYIDTGKILVQKALSIGDTETTPQLSERLSGLGAEALIEALDMLAAGKSEGTVQDNSLATSAPRLRKEEGRIDWAQPARTIYNRIRAFKPFPGSFTLLRGERIVIEWGQPVSGSCEGVPGTVCVSGKEGLRVACATESLLVTKVKPEGKKIMDAVSFANGRRLQAGERFE
jgi:methionyl-tRNA formyltransferase